ncbi:MAG: urease accessory protein UreD [Nitrospinae bacterium]|nr:urease accessory protein UreD [Nitrospinota bacterium]
MAQSGRWGRAELFFRRRGPRTILHRNYTTLPAQVIRPFYWEGSGRAYLYLLTPTGGMLGGDRLDIHIVLGPHAQVCLTTASATKVHPSTAASAEQSLAIELGPGSSLEYLPEPTILFHAAHWWQRTVVRRAVDSRLLLLEGWSAGRVAQHEVFQFSSLETTIEVYTEERLSLFDRMRICPAAYPYQALGLWEGRPHLLTMYLLQETHPVDVWLRAIQEELSADLVLAGVSRLEAPGIAARVLAGEAETLTRVTQTLWQKIREGLWGEPWNPWRKL